MTSRGDLDPATVAVALGRGRDVPGEPLNVPPVLASVYHPGVPLEYGREANPTWEALEEVLGGLEGGTALAFASGMAAVAAVLDTVREGGAVVFAQDAYSGTRQLLQDLAARGRVAARPVDSVDTQATLAACEGAAMLWLESPTNPMMAVPDLPALCAGARELGARTVVDNTFATPMFQRPLAFGADVVLHSLSKFIGGHSDLVLGAVVTEDQELLEQIRHRRVHYGGIAGPFEAWLALRGIRTLPVRMDRAQENAGVLARRLSEHRAVSRVRYPGLPEDPGHARAKAQMRGFGAVLAFELHGGAEAADRVCAAISVAVHATSLGGVETTMERRNRWAGEDAVPASLIRLSAGCEHVEDVWHDLEQALDQTVKG
jgi:cystathionine gamma-synthase